MLRSHVYGMISTKRSVEYTTHAVLSFLQHTSLRDSDVLVVIDNDGSLEELGSLLEKAACIEVWRNDSELSFAENANNLILLALEAESDLFLLNNDLIFSEGWLEPLLEDSKTILSSISNRELSYDNPQFNLSASLSLDEYLGREQCFAALVQHHRSRYYGTLNRVVLPFFCTKVPYDAFSRIGAFDTTFGKAGAEDFDYCIRAHLMGIDVSFKLQSYVLHFGGRSTWADTKEPEIRQREVRRFMNVFREKWGEKIFELIFYSSLATIHEADVVANYIYDDDFSSAIKSLIA